MPGQNNAETRSVPPVVQGVAQGVPPPVGGKGRKRRGMSVSHPAPSTPIKPGQDNSNVQSGADASIPRKKKRGPNTFDSSHATIIAFRTRSGRGFDRVFDGSFSIDRARSTVRTKCGLANDAPVALWYETENGSAIQLDDDDDLRAFRVHAQRSSTIVVHVDAETVEAIAAQPSKQDQAPKAPAPAKAVAQPKQVAAVAAAAQEQHDDDTSTAEVSAGLIETPTSEHDPKTPEPAKKTRRSRKRKQVFDDNMSDNSDAPLSSQVDTTLHESPAAESFDHGEPPVVDIEEAPSSQVTEQSEPEQHEPAQREPESEEPSEEPSSQEPASQEPSSADEPKTKRTRRTKAEMEVFRAEQAAKKAAREQEREQRKSKGKSPAKTASAAAANESAADTTVVAADETTIVHDVASDLDREIDEITALGREQVDRKLQELKEKKQRKNGHERELQRRLLKYVEALDDEPAAKGKKGGADESVAEAAQPSAGAAAEAETADEADSDASTASDDYFSQPESHMNTSSGAIHGPMPPPSQANQSVGPSESTPRASSERKRAPSTFKKLSELRPSVLRRTLSQGTVEAPAPQQPPQPEEDDSDDDSSDSDDSSSSSEDETPTPSGSIPLAKQAGASAVAASERETRAKKKQSFFSAFK
ncbi:hypothetical protein MCUN1_003313 [Malassezia cuniculi]|uniref:Uncharacterized protein n=1 Tax=Malassezia cuniculi TaxID=948313 RepID=A0AAF0J855_9BASI|nr:hypothetical protein MCUN1_003313 [Malassezia cuniculi]